MKYIGLDIGTTTISTVVLETDARKVLESRTVSNGSFIQTSNDWERIQDPEIIISKAVAVLDEFLVKYPDVSGIGLTGQMHGIVYTGADGRAVSPLFTWQDQRALLCENSMSVIDSVSIKTGIHLAAGYGLATHLYQKAHGLVPGSAVSLCTIPDYLGMVLTERKKPLMHISMAASIGFFDCVENRFDQDAFTAAGGEAGILPEVTDRLTVLGNYRGYPVTVALGDNQASFLGSVGMEKDVLLLNVGTGGQISVLSDRPFEAPGIESRPLSRDKYLLVGASLCGGRAYAILERFFRSYIAESGGKDEPQYDIMEKLAVKALGKRDGMKIRTTFNGTRADPDLRGSITNISEDTFTPEGLVIGVLRGMVDELHGMFLQIHDGTGTEIRRIIGSGNGIRRNKVLQRLASEAFGAELTLAAYDEEAACGAAVGASGMSL